MADSFPFHAPYDQIATAVPVTLRDSTGAAVSSGGNVFTTILFTPVLDTNQYADGDILFDTIAVASVFASASSGARLDSIHVLDENDQGVAFDLIFFNALTSLGTINAAPSISDANARTIIAPPVQIGVTDYVDLGGSQIAGLRNLGLILFTGATSLWVAGITRGGTPTYTASGLRITLGITR